MAAVLQGAVPGLAASLDVEADLAVTQGRRDRGGSGSLSRRRGTRRGGSGSSGRAHGDCRDRERDFCSGGGGVDVDV